MAANTPAESASAGHDPRRGHLETARDATNGSPTRQRGSPAFQRTSRSPELAGTAPSPAEIAEFNDELEHLIGGLDEEAGNVLDLKLQQLTNEEIAAELKCSERTVRRISKRIQTQLLRMVESD